MTSVNKKIKVELREIIFSNEKGKSFCDVFIYEPENVEEQMLGDLYIVGEIVNFSENSSYLVNLLASIAKKEFYSNPKKSTIESLEASLHKINSTLSDLAQQGIVDWVGNLNMSCSTYKNGSLHLSQVGKIKIILIRDGQITDIGEKITNKENPHPFRTFSNIASGDLESGDLVLFATPEFFDIFPLEKLRRLISSLDIEELTEMIQNSIGTKDDINTVGLLIMKIEEDKKEKLSRTKIEPTIKNKEKEIIPTPIKINIKKENQENNLQKITTEEKNIQQTIDEDKLSLEDIIEEYEKNDTKKEFATEDKTKKINSQKESFLYKQKQEIEIEEKDEFLSSLDEETKTKYLTIINENLKNVIALFKNKILYPIFNQIKNLILKMKNNFSKKENQEIKIEEKISLLSKNKKLILLVSFLIILFLTGNFLLHKYQDKQTAMFNEYSNTIIQAEKKINQAEIDSIINKPKARKFLLEARNIINKRNISLNKRNEYKNLNNKALELLNKIQQQLDVIDFVDKINNPNMIIDFEQIENIQTPEKIIENNGAYYVIDSKNNLINEIDLINGEIKDFKIESDKNISNILTSMRKTKEVIFPIDSNKMGIFNIEKEVFSSLDIKLLKNHKITDISSYSNFLYFLDTKSNQIYKYKKLTNGFDEGKSWIKDTNINIKDAVSMTIDGSIYILKSNGSIEKFRTGNKEKISFEIPSDKISALAKIYTKPELKYLYIYDSQKNRVIVFDKRNGTLVKQYISDKWNNLKNIIVNNKETKLYLLSGNNIFEVKINIKD